MKPASINICRHKYSWMQTVCAMSHSRLLLTFMQGQAHGQKKQHSQYMWAASVSAQKEEKEVDFDNCRAGKQSLYSSVRREYYSLCQCRSVCVRERATWVPTYPQLWVISSHPEAEWRCWPIQRSCFLILSHTHIHTHTHTQTQHAQAHTKSSHHSHIITSYISSELTTGWLERETLIINTTVYYFMATANCHSPERKSASKASPASK